MAYSKDHQYLSQQMFEQVQSKDALVKEPLWLIYAETDPGSSITSSQIVGFTEYAKLNSYQEDMKLVSKQMSGSKGVYANNLLLSIPSSGVSIEFFNQFSGQAVLNKIILSEIILANNSSGTSSNTSPSSRQSITYSTCRIESYKRTIGHEIELSVFYNQRSATYTQYENGAKAGKIVSSNFS